ncbi:undecaprenyl diphosphate synthase family protein [Geomonas sp. RF6]|uniref:undecaprenyl diphosphate synthase family protein n=1 Tax=Geomonas sp. RF6 TaxID=2897342 RepID=UPI001E3C7927|nr:undecaprenyl diphosphate synthase family protein [Geomonas sp. RF6]UFS70255.1 undecaprenyl diphosphate synthase family protein [Geomonas sp. RF6]
MAIRSIGVIPDGTRRWAAREGISLPCSYAHAFKNLTKHIDALSKRGVRHIHVYMFSLYNLKRIRDEIDACLDAECEFIDNLVAREIPIAVYGDIEAMRDAHARIAEIMERLRYVQHPEGDATTVHLYIGYSFENHLRALLAGKREISSIVESLAAERIDLLIRTGGASTLSDFLPIHSRYAQLHFLPALFNDFTVRELISICEQHDAASKAYKYGE